MSASPKNSPPCLGRPKGKNKLVESQRRQQLIEATVETIVQHGLADTTLAKVADYAGLSQGIVVHYFGNKQRLLLETLRAHCEEHQNAWQAALVKAGGDPVDRIVTLLTVALTDELSTPRHLALWFTFWGEVKTHPQYAEVINIYGSERKACLNELCRNVEGLLDHTGWNVTTLSNTTDAIADGLLLKMHVSPEVFSASEARAMLGEFLAVIFPLHKKSVMKVLATL